MKNFVRCVSDVDSLLPWVLSAAIVGTVAVAQQAVAGGSISIDPRRSLVVTEQTILARFPFERVLEQLVMQSWVPQLTSLELFQQWWDTQNSGPGLGLGPHCDDTVDAGTPVINGFPYTCRPAPAEGVQATTNPFADPDNNPDAYLPVGLFNRFDVAPSDGSHCGEYRIVYAKRSGIANPLARNLVIFEAALPNPHPNQGLKGCKKIVAFWASLTYVDDINLRADMLEHFYFNGIPGVVPVIHVDHYGGNTKDFGQVRTNQFMQDAASPRVWNLREFKLRRTCSGGNCTAMQFIPVTDKSNPFGPLFSPTSIHAKAPNFQDFFPSQVSDLAVGNLAKINMKVPDNFNTGQGLASGSTESNYVTQFGTDPSPLRTAIQDQLTAIGSSLTPDHVIRRAQALACAGCHRLNNSMDIGGGLTWPPSLGFTHVSERNTETVDGQVRFLISDALVNAFLPHRKTIMEDYLNDKLKKPKKPKDPIGRKRVH
jgi:hypothetical protein